MKHIDYIVLRQRVYFENMLFFKTKRNRFLGNNWTGIIDVRFIAFILNNRWL